MGDFFQVDLDVLQQFLDSLNRAKDNMQAALEAMEPDEGHDIGTFPLNFAADDFQDTWHYGMGQIRDMVEDTTEGVRDVKNAYQACDDEAARAFDMLGSVLE